MCSVIGYYSKKPKRQHLEDLFLIWNQSKIRGLHAFGFVTEKGKVEKSNDLSFIQMMSDEAPFTTMIGHCRYSTSGDYKEPRNNQPISVGDAHLVFNGVITMESKPEYEARLGRSFETENDGEIALMKFIEEDGWVEFISKAKFSFAGIFMKNGRAFAIRNKNRPLWYAKKDGAVFIASTRDILIRSAFEAEACFEFPVGQALELSCL